MNPPHGSYAPPLEGQGKAVTLEDRNTVTDVIGKIVSEATRRTFGANVRAVILTGSLSRNEASIQRDSEGIWRVKGDAEFLILLAAECPLPIDWDTERNGLEIEALLLNQGIDCPISLGYCHEGFFRSMTPHMFAYETRETGTVISGEAESLTLIPAFAPSDIPLEDAWRTLSNRMIELAEAMAAQSAPNSNGVPQEVAYRSMKLTLDTATSVLLFEGKYAPTYSQRAENFSRLAATAERLSGSTIPLRDFAHAVATCTNWKLSGDVPAGYVSWEWVRSTCQRAIEVWKWELRRLSGERPDPSLEKLLKTAMQRQSLTARARGWVSVIRSEGWLRSLRWWPRWLIMALRTTPRYWTYEAVGELFLRIDEYLLNSSKTQADGAALETLRVDLPLWPSGTLADSRNWRLFARAIAFNYHRYLEGTRS